MTGSRFVVGWTLLVLGFGAGETAAQPRPADPPAALCAGQAGCRVIDRRAAERDSEGRRLTVAEVAITEAGCRPHRRQFWAIVEGVAPARLLLDLCNDGYGDAGVGEDRIVVGPNRVVHTQSGGSEWHWTVSRTLQVSPPRVTAETNRVTWTRGPNATEDQWDWRRLGGQSTWWAPDCRPDGTPEPGEARPANRPAYEYAPIPLLPTALAPPSARDAELGSCAFALDASGRGGYVVVGAPLATGAANEWLRVLMLGARTLMVTVGNGPWTSGNNPALDDHVALWVGRVVGYGGTCLDPRDRASLWRIRIADGTITRGSPDTIAPIELRARRERRAQGSTVVTFVIELPAIEPMITVALNRGDGQRAVRSIATSRLRANSLASVGQAMPLRAGSVRCEVRDGRLELVEAGRIEMLHPGQ